MNSIPVFSIDLNSFFKNIDYYAGIFIRNKALAIRGSDISIRDQKEISLKLNNFFDYTPKFEDEFHVLYKENHSHVISKKNNNKNSILIDWHLEHAESINPQVMAVWNMKVFNCDEASGMTGFVSSDKVLNSLSRKEVDFLKKCKIIPVNDDGSHINFFVDEKNISNQINPTNAISLHPVTKFPTLRVDVLNRQSLISFNDQPVNAKDIEYFDELYLKIYYEVTQNTDNQFWWSWKRNDILIVDLFSLYHAVKGGFSLGERVFAGFWSFLH
jgi:alpha-ketoglutarate-dependent taurine dioxygenase